MKIRNVLPLLFISATALLTQDNAWQIKLAGSDMLSDISVQNIVGDSLAISQAGQARRIAVDDIVEMRRAGKSKFWKGAGIGFLAGGATGALVAATTYEEPANSFAAAFTLDRGSTIVAGAILGGFPGFIIGGLLGSSAGKEQVHDLSNKTREQKLATLRFIISI